jgi:uncharacterized alpha/beta hydrolase family protein
MDKNVKSQLYSKYIETNAMQVVNNTKLLFLAGELALVNECFSSFILPT